MNFIQKTSQWFNPGLHLGVSTGISALTAILAFRSVEIEDKTMITFIAFYIILAGMTIMFIYRSKLTNPQTRQMLKFSFFLLGFVLMVTGILGMLNGGTKMLAVFLLMLFLPGFASLRAGLHFNKRGD